MASDERLRGNGSPPTSGVVRAAALAAVLGCIWLVGCASVRSAQDKVGGWIGGLSGEAEAEPQSPPPAAATAKRPVKKPAVSAAPSAPAADATQESVTSGEPLEAGADASPELSDPAGETQAPESSIFDPY